MIQRFTIARYILLSLVACLLGLTGFAYYMQRSDLNDLHASSIDNHLWSAVQLELELHRFVGMLGRLGAGDETIDAEDVIMRFDILWSRLEIFKNGPVGADLRNYEGRYQTIASLSATMREHEESVLSLARDSHAEIMSLLIAFGYHEKRVRALSVAVNRGDVQKISELRSRIGDNQLISTVISVALVLLTFVLLFLAYFDKVRSRKHAETQAELARDAEAANRAKERFLAMMSHELRTPMNGVLGQLALAKLPGLPAAQLRLVEQAERSGRQLIGMLVDILDFSALQDNRLVVADTPFDLVDLADEIGDALQRPVGTSGGSITIEVAERAPRRIQGDESRLRQAIAHIVVYIADTAGTRNARLLVDHIDGELRCTLSFLYDDSTAGAWRPDLILGKEDPDQEQFAAEALGPVIARGLIENMGGRIELTALYEGQTALMMAVPAAVVEEARPKVTLNTSTATMKMMCEAVLKGAEVDLIEEGSGAGAVNVALIETSHDDADRIDSIRRQYPEAKLIALGAPAKPSIYDGVAALPLEVNALRDVIYRQIA